MRRQASITALALAGSLAIAATPAMAQQQSASAPDPRRGATIAAQGTQGGAAPCAQCHGERGQGDPDGPFPRLAGQPASYLWKQLQDYASGSRPNDIMTPIAQSLSEQDRADTSAYFAGLRGTADSSGAKTGKDKDKDEQAQAAGGASDEKGNGAKAGPDSKKAGDAAPDLGTGRTLATMGRTAIGDGAKGIQACGNCHGPGGRGEPPLYPALAGQLQGYAVAQLQAFKSGQRHNDTAAVMQEIAGKLSDEDMNAVAAYFQSLSPDARTARVGGKADGAGPD